MHIFCEDYNITLYYNRKIGYKYIWGAGGPLAPKVSEFHNFVDFRAHLGGVDPLKVVSQ